MILEPLKDKKQKMMKDVTISKDNNENEKNDYYLGFNKGVNDSFNEFASIIDLFKKYKNNVKLLMNEQKDAWLKFIKYYENLNRLSRRGYSTRFVELLAAQGVTEKSRFKDKDFMDKLFKIFQDKGFDISDIKQNEEDGYFEFLVMDTQNGGQYSSIDWYLLSSPELRQLTGINKDLAEIHKGEYTISGEDKKVEDPQELLNVLIEKAKKGLNIQRYKGLGEMNPGQLWTTTMNPEKRTLLQVRIEDVVDADDIFTILMGDKVEPRREFIQNNALEVTELDI